MKDQNVVGASTSAMDVSELREDTGVAWGFVSRDTRLEEALAQREHS